MPHFICVTCGLQYADTAQPPPHCPICADERQYINPKGQAWTTLAEVQAAHHNRLQPLEPGLIEIVTEPRFGIGQRALLVQGARGNVLWDCLGLIDDATVSAVRALGGVSALACSHPHMFGSLVAWSHALGGAPIWLHRDLAKWVQRPDPVIRYWDGERHELEAGVSLIRCGGHFRGSTVLLWPAGAAGRGVLLSSDSLYVTPDRRHVAFMRSYPNYIPLSPAAVEQIVAVVRPLAFDRMYGNFPTLEIEAGAQEAVQRSWVRYRHALGLS